MPLGAIPQEVVAPYRFVNCIPLMVFAKSRTIGADMQFLSRLPLAAKVAALAALVISVVALGAGFYAVTQINARMAEIVEGQVRDRSIHMSRAAESARVGQKQARVNVVTSSEAASAGSAVAAQQIGRAHV